MANGLLSPNPLDDPDYDYGTILPLRRRNMLDVDETSDDGLEIAFPSLLRDVANSAVRMGQMARGERAPGLLLGDVMDFSPAGTLARIPAGALGAAMGPVMRQADTPSSTAPSMYDLPPGSDPRYLGAAPDRTDFSFLRYTPKAETARVQSSLAAMRDVDNPTRQQMMRDIDRGIELGGADWYNTEELRDWFVKELGEERGSREWAEYMDLMGAASPGSKVPANIGNASEIRRRLASNNIPRNSNQTEGEAYRGSLLDIEKLDDARAIARGRTKGYGHKTQGLQELITARQQQGQWSGDPEPGVAPGKGNWSDNPKPKGFAQSLKGSERNIAADLHFTRYMAMASQNPQWLSTQAEIGKDTAEELKKIGGKKISKYFGSRKVNGKVMTTFNPKKAVAEGKLSVEDISKLDSPQMWADMPNDSEYAAMEALMYDIGKETGMTGPQVQAALWMGAADRTGVDPTSQGTFMDLFRRRADERAKKEGMSREQVIRRFIKDKGLLSTPGVPVMGLLPRDGDSASNSPTGLLGEPAGWNRQFLLRKMEDRKRMAMEEALQKNFRSGMSGGAI
jgi:hypothetical protein